jgi:ribosomal protein S18 acetylase RimI-like enzyme
MNYKQFGHSSLTHENIDRVHQFCEDNVRNISHSLETFKATTIQSRIFDPSLSVVLTEESGEIIAFFMGVLRKSLILKRFRKVAVLKFFIVHKDWRNRGIGTYLINHLTEKIEKSDNKSFRMKFEVMSSAPDYWYPGLDPRLTEAFFFLKKHGFKKGIERINLCKSLGDISSERPPSAYKGYRVKRAEKSDEEELVRLSFMPKLYQWSFWPDEIILSFQNSPITTFIVIDLTSEKIIGWASHSIQFPGSFGPTGVKKSERGRGLGKLLLKWCLWDLKTNFDVDQMIINWVQENTTYFYSKSIGAYICGLYWTMKKRF